MQLSTWSLPVRNWKWWYILVAMAAAFILPLIPTIVVTIVTMGQGMEDPMPFLNAYAKHLEVLKFTIFAIVPIFLMALLGWRWTRRGDLGLDTNHITKIAIASVVGFAFYIGATYTFTQLVSGASEASKQVGNSLGIGKSLSEDILTILLVACLTPIAEEIFFRGFLFRSLRDGLSNTFEFFKKHFWITLLVANLVSSYFFMMSHGGGGQELQLYMIGLMGVIAATAYAWTGSIYAPILIHGFNNTYAMYELGKAHFVNPTLSLALIASIPFLTIAIVYVIQIFLAKDDIVQKS